MGLAGIAAVGYAQGREAESIPLLVGLAVAAIALFSPNLAALIKLAY